MLTCVSIKGNGGVRVKRDGNVIVEYRARTSYPKLKSLKSSKHLDALWVLCFEQGVKWEEFVSLFNIDEKYMWDNLTLD